MAQHCDGEPSIVPLMLARQAGQGHHKRAVGIAIEKLALFSCTIPALCLRNKRRTDTRCYLRHACGHSLGIRHGDKRRAGFGDARLFKTDPLQWRVSGAIFWVEQKGFMIEAQLRNAGDNWGRNDVRRVEPPAEANFDNCGICWRPGKGQKGGGGRCLKKAWANIGGFGCIKNFGQNGR